MKNYFTKHNIFSFLIVAALICNISVSSISNSSTISFLIKCISSALLLFILFIDIYLSGGTLKSFITSRGIKSILFFSAVIIAYLSITLLYSSNSDYGTQKIINIIISVLPNIIVLYYIINTLYKKPYKEKFFIIIVLGFSLTLAAILIFKPFDHSTIYQFTPQRWSHVFIGRIISFLTLIVFMFLLDAKDLNKILFYSAIFITGFYITYLTGLRSALIGIVLCTSILFFWNLYKKNIIKTHLYSIAFIIILVTVLVYITPQGFSTQERLSNLTKIENLDFGGDAPILTRVESYKLSWQMFLEKPIIGWGFGSFNGYDNLEWTRIGKYPHNIILEILSELGLVGFVLFCLLMFYMINRIYNYQFTIISEEPEVKGQMSKVRNDYTLSILILLVFSLWMAMWSKDISTQSLLWLFLIFVGIDKKQEVKK